MEGCLQLTQSDFLALFDVIFWPALVLGGLVVAACMALWFLTRGVADRG